MAGRGVGGASGAFAPGLQGGAVELLVEARRLTPSCFNGRSFERRSTKPRTIHRSPGRRGRPSASGLLLMTFSPAADEALEGLPSGDLVGLPAAVPADCGFSTNRLYGHRPHVAATLAGRLVGPLAAGPRLRPAGVRRKPRRRRPRRLTEGPLIGPREAGPRAMSTHSLCRRTRRQSQGW